MKAARQRSTLSKASMVITILVALVAGSALVACPPTFVNVPPVSQDAPPAITITNYLSSGYVSQANSHASGTVGVFSGTSLTIAAYAENPGGTQDFSLNVSGFGQQSYAVDTSSVRNTSGQVPTTLHINGTDGAGHAGTQPISLSSIGSSPITVHRDGDQLQRTEDQHHGHLPVLHRRHASVRVRHAGLCSTALRAGSDRVRRRCDSASISLDRVA